MNVRQRRIQSLVCVSVLLLLPFMGNAQKPSPKKKIVIPAIATMPAPTPLQYGWQVGKTYRYKVLGVFNGHIPPFAQSSSPPIHIRIDLEYSAEVTKQIPKGVIIAFHVEKADLFLLEKEPDENGKPPAGTEELLFPIPLEQVKDALDVTATLASNGQVVEVSGGDANSVKVNFGFELRKLFMLMLPITFPPKGITPGTAWTFDDGLLGKNAGKTTYNATLKTLSTGKATSAQIDLKSNSQVLESVDKDGKPTQIAANAVETTTGTASLVGSTTFVGPATPKATLVRLQKETLKLTIDVTRKRTLPDPNKPEEPLENRIDVQAILKIQALPSLPIKPEPKKKP